MVAVAHRFAVHQRRKTFALHTNQLRLVERCIRGVQPHLGIVAQMLQQLPKFSVLVRNRLIVDIVVGHQREELEAHPRQLVVNLEYVVERVEGIVFLVEYHPHTLTNLAAVLTAHKVAPQSCQGAYKAFVAITVGRIDVDSVLHIENTWRNVHCRIALLDFAGQHHRPAVDHRHRQEMLLVGQALGGRETPVGIGEMRQILLIACQAEKRGGKDVERKRTLRVVDRIERRHLLIPEAARLLVLYSSLKQQVARTYEQSVAQLLTAVAQLRTIVALEDIKVDSDFKIQPEQMAEQHIQRVPQTVGHSWYVNKQHKANFASN